MKLPTTQLGKTNIEATIISLGTCVYRYDEQNDTVIQREQRIRSIRYALESGINYIDTAPAYGNRLDKSQSVLGEALIGIPRNSYYLTTKSMLGEWETDKWKNLACLQRFFEDSLEILQVDYVDGYLLHEAPVILESPDAISECTKEIQKYKEQGLIRGGIGIGTVELDTAKVVLEQGWADIIQIGGGRYTYRKNAPNPSEIHPDFIEAIQQQGIGFTKCQVFCSNRDHADQPTFYKDALEYVLNTEFIDIAVVGMHTTEDVDKNIAVVKYNENYSV